MNNSKCNKCGLVNPAADMLCRRCGGMLGLPVRKSLTEEKTRSPRYLFLLPFLLMATGFGFWYSLIRKSAVDSIHLDKEEWHELTMDSKVNPKDPPVATKPRNLLDDIPPEKREEMRRQVDMSREWYRTPEKIKIPQSDEYKKAEQLMLRGKELSGRP